MPHAQAERRLLCDALALTGPEAETLCEGWNAHDLAAHLWLRENDPLAAGGIVVKGLAEHTEAKSARLKRLLTFEQLIAQLRAGPPRLSLFGIPGMDEAANTVEFFVHGEDLRRPNPSCPAHPADPAFDDWLWQRLRLIGRALFRRASVGILLEREEDGSVLRVSPGTSTVTILGNPREVTLYGFGRTSAARVRLIGQPDALAALGRTPLAA